MIIACGGKNNESESAPRTGSTTASTGSAIADAADTHVADVASSDAASSTSKGPTMTTDFKPYNAFRDHAVKRLGVGADELVGGAIDEATAKTQPNSIGNAFAYTMFPKATPPRDVRGWVTRDGTVITAEQNLGLLFAEAKVWDKKPAITPKELATKLTWSYGMNHRVLVAPEKGQPVPTLEMKKDGTGTFRWFMGYREPGPGGAGGGPESVSEMIVTLTADKQATLERKPK